MGARDPLVAGLDREKFGSKAALYVILFADTVGKMGIKSDGVVPDSGMSGALPSPDSRWGHVPHAPRGSRGSLIF